MECSENHSAFHYFNSFFWSNLESFTSFRIRKGEKRNVKPNQFKKQTFIITIFIVYFRTVCNLVYNPCQNRSKTGGLN